MTLNPKQRLFKDEYLVDLNATAAAIRAGYSEKTAYSQGQRLLKHVEIAAAIEEAQAERSERTGITQDWVLTTIYETVERCKQAHPVLDRKGEAVYVETPRGKSVPAYTFDSKAVLRGAELAGKHLGMFPDKHEHTGKDGGPIKTKSITDLKDLSSDVLTELRKIAARIPDGDPKPAPD